MKHLGALSQVLPSQLGTLTQTLRAYEIVMKICSYMLSVVLCGILSD